MLRSSVCEAAVDRGAVRWCALQSTRYTWSAARSFSFGSVVPGVVDYGLYSQPRGPRPSKLVTTQMLESLDCMHMLVKNENDTSILLDAPSTPAAHHTS